MLAAVIEGTTDEIIVQDEVGNTHKITNESDDFLILEEFYSMDSYFEFDPIAKKVIHLDVEVDLEDYSLPEDFS